MRTFLLTGLAGLSIAAPVVAQEKAAPVTPNDVIAAAPASDWLRIAPDDLMVMDLAPDADGRARRVVIQLMPAPFSQGWVENIRKLVAARWFDGIAVVRVQDNYVVQWGDPDGEDPKKAKPLPTGLGTVPESEYQSPFSKAVRESRVASLPRGVGRADQYSGFSFFDHGWPLATDNLGEVPIRDAKTGNPIPADPNPPTWPVHCYGMVGVGRNNSPDTGTGAELYTVIGQAPRQLDRNIALVGRIVEGMENFSSLPRGTGPLGFYEKAEERTPIVSVRMGNEVASLPAYEYLSTESQSFSAYVEKRANRKDAFFIQPAGGVDVCNVPVPIRRAEG